MTAECISKCVPFVPTPESEMWRILQLVGLRPKEVFVELGCGDGQNLRIAAAEFGAIGIGYELDEVMKFEHFVLNFFV
jgi:tRNA G46 methylase TrmB